MKTKLMMGLAALLLAGIAGSLGAGPAAQSEQEIRLLEKRVNEAFAKNDLPAYFSYYAPDLVQWMPEGRADLEKYKKDWGAYVGAGNTVQALEIRDMIVRMGPSEDTAVASYSYHMKIKLADGKITEEDDQETDVWFKRNGKWKIVALHESPAAKK
jgi:ketosteroid isomerase-like protein